MGVAAFFIAEIRCILDFLAISSLPKGPADRRRFTLLPRIVHVFASLEGYEA